MEKFNKNQVKLESKKDGVTGKQIHNVMVKVNDNRYICHSSFYNINDAIQCKNEITISQ